ncbi:MAG TPA: PEP-CTERM sorting domain-containing protein [Terriglobales bacterium]|nr:PEP-CTERM sorting domain-containing protein [Terriglobales bacterium]
MKKQWLVLGLLSVFCLLMAGVANADNVQVPFPTAGDYYCSATNGCGYIPSGGQTAYMWTQGDYVISSNFTSTGLSSVTGLMWDFTIQNYLGGGNNETVDILLNDTMVGSFTALDCGYCGNYQQITGSVNFSGIAPVNGGYTLEMELTNTIPSGGGSIAFTDGGEFTLIGSSGGTVPEPSSILLFGSGALGVFGLLRRKIKL